MNEHKANEAAVAKAANTPAQTPAFLKRDAAAIDALTARANQAEQGGAPLTVSEKLALELAQNEGLITAEKSWLEKPAKELMAEGFRQDREKHIGEATSTVDELERISLEVRKVRVAPDWFDFKAKRAATARTVELKAEFDKVKGQLLEPFRMIDDGGFKNEVNEHIAGLEAVFEAPFRKP
ncbi:MAG: hypothetical protein IMZ46_05690 [Acidobacteria bacterium]|nr:hypothetical protein [Acidobacteriota bacterium]